MTPRSILNCPGPLTIPVLLFPNAVPMPSAPITGGVVKHDVLKYPSSLLLTEPAVTRFELLHPGASWARSSLMPKTFVKLLYAIVSAVPDCKVSTPDVDQPLNRAFGTPSVGEGKAYTALHIRRCVRSELALPQRCSGEF